MKLFFTLLGLFAVLAIQAQKTIINDPNAEARPVSPFSAIRISGGIDLYISQADREALAVSAAETEYRSRIKTVVENGVLKISYEDAGKPWKSGNKKLKAYVAFATLKKLDASGASDVFVDGTIKGDELSINLSGASDFKGAVQVNKLDLDQRGASDATISGRVANLEVNASGASDLKGFDLSTDVCNAKAHGASDVKITVEKQLQVEASGASSIQYKGNAVITSTKTNGASSVNKKG
ncbi:MAG: DUF2807 domain-containing protein [Williamsia sp.]|nr:DUF2807 domain-containing protein [Williamsia sp.]